MRKRPLLLAASFFLAGISYAAVKDIRLFVLLPICALYLMIPQIKVFGWSKKGLRKAFASGIISFILFAAGIMHMERQMEFRENYLSKLTEGQNTTILGEISKVETSSFGYQIYVSDCYIFQNSKYIPCNHVLVYASDSQFHVGEIHKITGKVHRFSAARNEGNFDSASYYKSQKIDFYINMETTEYVADHANGIIKNVLKLKEKLGNVYDACLSEIHAGIIKGMVTGDKSTLDENIKDLFTIAGISHILAISGLHVSVIGRGLYNCLRKIGCGFLLSGIVAGIVLVLYGIMTGNGVSARRAIGMLLIYMVGQVFGRSYDMLNGLGAMCLFLLWENPFLIGYSGFWFFVSALFGVGFIGDAFTADCKKSKADTRNQLALLSLQMQSALWMSIGVTLATLPIVAYCYFEVPMLSSLINCVIIPFLTPLFFCALFGGIAGLFCIPLAKLLLFPCGWILQMYEWICRLNEKLSFFTVITGKPTIEKIMFYYLVLMVGILLLKYWQNLIFVKNKEKLSNIQNADNQNNLILAKREEKTYNEEDENVIQTSCGRIMKPVLTILCFFIIIYQPKHTFELSFLDVGQGDGIYICDGEGSDFFIDGGSTDEKELGERCILPFLKSNAIRKIDYWFVTHADTDHISGLLEVLESGYKITYLVLPKAVPKDENYKKLVLLAEENQTNILYMEAGNYIKTKGLQFECLYPENIEINDRNDASLVLELKKGSFRALFTGDISSDVEKQLVKQGVLNDISLYKAAHHGSKNSNCTEFLQALLPEIAVISCGKDNSYGHPSKESIERMENVGSTIYYTMESGQVTITEKGEVFSFQESD